MATGHQITYSPDSRPTPCAHPRPPAAAASDLSSTVRYRHNCKSSVTVALQLPRREQQPLWPTRSFTPERASDVPGHGPPIDCHAGTSSLLNPTPQLISATDLLTKTCAGMPIREQERIECWIHVSVVLTFSALSKSSEPGS